MEAAAACGSNAREKDAAQCGCIRQEARRWVGGKEILVDETRTPLDLTSDRDHSQVVCRAQSIDCKILRQKVAVAAEVLSPNDRIVAPHGRDLWDPVLARTALAGVVRALC